MAISSRVKKILAARQVQKSRVEDLRDQSEAQERDISIQQKPVVDALRAEFDQQNQQQVNLATQHLLQLQDANESLKNLKESVTLPPVTFDSEEAEAIAGQTRHEGAWIQEIFSRFRDAKTTRTSTFELDVSSSRIGDQGQINVPKLFNQGELHLSINGKKQLEVSPKNVTKGLVALLLLPFNDLKKSNITIKQHDIMLYNKIMTLAGISKNGKSAGKYKAYIAPNIDSPTKTGTGCAPFPYTDPASLEKKLQILYGSKRAGNTSQSVSREMRAIVDELHNVRYIPDHVHKTLYHKLNFI